MNKDYLWDKTGEDMEIEGLESLLASLRYQPTAPPALPVAFELTTATKAPGWKFSLTFAVPACLLIAVFAGFWMTRQTPQLRVVNEVNEIQPPIASHDPISETDESEPKKTTPKLVRTVFTPGSKKKARTAIRAKYRKPSPKLDTLTSEERFAYDQLMLALSITGSKLKVVSDTINRAED